MVHTINVTRDKHTPTTTHGVCGNGLLLLPPAADAAFEQSVGRSSYGLAAAAVDNVRATIAARCRRGVTKAAHRARARSPKRQRRWRSARPSSQQLQCGKQLLRL